MALAQTLFLRVLPVTLLLIHSLSNSATHLLTHLMKHPLIYTHKPTYSHKIERTYRHTHVHSLAYLLTDFTYSLPIKISRSLTHSNTNLTTILFALSPTHFFIHYSIYHRLTRLLTHPFVFALLPLCALKALLTWPRL